jgi:hypothetical protein
MSEPKKMTAAQFVSSHIEKLKTATVGELTAIGKSSGFDSRAGFSSYKRALAAAGIDYDTMLADRRQEKIDAAEDSVTHEVELFTDAKASAQRFGIADSAGEPLWYGRFFDDDRDFNGEQSSGELAAAKKAVWLASKVAAAVSGKVRLLLNVDADWLTWANSDNPKVGGKAQELRRAADRLGVVLSVRHVAGTSNPADVLTTRSGYQKYQDYRPGLTALATPIERQQNDG